MAINLACVPVIWFLYPETKTKPLESIKVLFGDQDSIAESVVSGNDHSGDSSKAAERVHVSGGQDLTNAGH